MQWPSCGDSTSQPASRQTVGSRYRIYAKRQASWTIPRETAKTADVVVLAPQIAILNEYQEFSFLVTEKAFDTITIQSKVIPFEHGKHIT